MKKKVTSVLASCVAASLIFTAFGGLAIAKEPAERTLVSTNTVYDCDGSGNGYIEYIYSDGSVEYEEFYASSGSSDDSSYDSSSDYYEDDYYEDDYYEDNYYEDDYYEDDYYEDDYYEEEPVEETITEEPVAEESTEPEYDGIEWTMDQIAAIPDVVSGVEDKEYPANSAHKYDVHMDVDFDKDIVAGILFNTSKIDFTTPGEYDMNYFVYFDREALLDYIEENDLNEEDFPGISDETEDRFEIMVSGKVTIQ